MFDAVCYGRENRMPGRQHISESRGNLILECIDGWWLSFIWYAHRLSKFSSLAQATISRESNWMFLPPSPHVSSPERCTKMRRLSTGTWSSSSTKGTTHPQNPLPTQQQSPLLTVIPLDPDHDQHHHFRHRTPSNHAPLSRVNVILWLPRDLYVCVFRAIVRPDSFTTSTDIYAWVIPVSSVSTFIRNRYIYIHVSLPLLTDSSLYSAILPRHYCCVTCDLFNWFRDVFVFTCQRGPGPRWNWYPSLFCCGCYSSYSIYACSTRAQTDFPFSINDASDIIRRALYIHIYTPPTSTRGGVQFHRNFVCVCVLRWGFTKSIWTHSHRVLARLHMPSTTNVRALFLTMISSPRCLLLNRRFAIDPVFQSRWSSRGR